MITIAYILCQLWKISLHFSEYIYIYIMKKSRFYTGPRHPPEKVGWGSLGFPRLFRYIHFWYPRQHIKFGCGNNWYPVLNRKYGISRALDTEIKFDMMMMMMIHTVSVIGQMFHPGKCASAIIAGSTPVRAIKPDFWRVKSRAYRHTTRTWIAVNRNSGDVSSRCSSQYTGSHMALACGDHSTATIHPSRVNEAQSPGININ